MSDIQNTVWQKGCADFDKLRLATANGACAEIYQYGAHLTSWRTAAGREWIFTSQQAEFSVGKAIRGGVPIIFPQFNAFGSGPRHGFARNHFWQLSQAPAASADHNRCVFSFSSTAETKAIWDRAFSTHATFDIQDRQLRISLSVANSGDKPLQFTGALHTYFAVNDFTQARLQGLEGLNYWDNNGTDFQQRQRATDNEVGFSGAIDRVYFNAKQPLTLIDGDQQLKIASEGFTEVVVWNPGAEASKKMSDMADEEWRKMVCVEAAVIDKPVTLAPGEVWLGRQIMTA